MKTKLLLILPTLFLLISCGSGLTGTWNIDRYEIVRENGQNTSAENIGVISFQKNGKGTKNIHYNIFDNEYEDKSSFTYEVNKEKASVTIKGEKGDESSFNKTWIMIEDKGKKQIWKSTDGANIVQTIELSK
ncbi:lipocalin family protein [Mesonia sp. K7]|uniref:lipocalin family protein n=1 Tax=Mesonia sp. K7 TaxID=2218606 RepID=UPI000DA82E6E|nr:lipocalin family protein [Mesonia sp. K7]PZD77888.1 hypothetical protein DNG35_07280 [Mesonia sp. K7]